MCIQYNPIGDYFPSENKTMNDYAGFKVGDQVEVANRPEVWTSGGGVSPMNISYPLRDSITRLFFDKCGIFTATISGYGFDIQHLVERNNIKKLPKYAVCDVVRARNSIFVVQEYSPLEECYYFGDRLPRLQEHNIKPFDGYRVGDTVWTVKRGRGKIVSEIMFGAINGRPFYVRFDNEQRDRSPKLSNLIPTETKYKEIVGAPKPYGFFVSPPMFVMPYNPIPCHTKEELKFVDFVRPGGKVQVAGCEEIKVNDAVLYRGKKWMVKNVNVDYVLRRSDHMGGYKAVVSREDISLWKEPKFKAGDVVFYNGEKWEVVYGYTYSKDFDYCISRGLDHLSVKESELRLWKETKITHDDRMERCSMTYAASDFKSLKYVGTHLNGFDIFSQDAGNGKVVIWYGIKGDDIQ